MNTVDNPILFFISLFLQSWLVFNRALGLAHRPVYIEQNKPSLKLLLSETNFSKWIPLPYSFILLYKKSRTNSQMNFCQPYFVKLIYKLKLHRQDGPKWSKTIVLKSFMNFPLIELDIFKDPSLSFILVYYLENCHYQTRINWSGQKTN